MHLRLSCVASIQEKNLFHCARTESVPFLGYDFPCLREDPLTWNG